jgi:hypothetical protein
MSALDRVSGSLFTHNPTDAKVVCICCLCAFSVETWVTGGSHDGGPLCPSGCTSYGRHVAARFHGEAYRVPPGPSPASHKGPL